MAVTVADSLRADRFGSSSSSEAKGCHPSRGPVPNPRCWKTHGSSVMQAAWPGAEEIEIQLQLVFRNLAETIPFGRRSSGT